MHVSALASGMIRSFLAIALSLWACDVPDTSTYAAGYSEAAFEALEEGVPRSAVLSALGPPLHIENTTPGEV